MSTTSVSLLRRGWGLPLLVILTIPNAPGAGLSLEPQVLPRTLAFSRYIASLQNRDPFTESGPVAMSIRASLPGLYKDAELVAIRATGEDERSQYLVLGIEGDGAVAEEVVGRYLELERQLERLPPSSMAIAPANYKFHFRGEVKMGGAAAFAYNIAPLKNRTGMIKGQLWMDETGAAILVSGRLKAPDSMGGSIDLVREIKFVDGASARVTHLSFAHPILGRSELVVIEYPLGADFGPPVHGACQDSDSVPTLDGRHRNLILLQ